MTAITRNDVTFTFDETLAWKWITALESGEFEQGFGGLQPTPGAYCCLGILCNAEDPTKWIRSAFEARTKWAFDSGYPPLSLLQQVGLNNVIGRYDGETWFGVYTSLARVNDSHNYSFLDIAGALREYYDFPPREENTNNPDN